MIKNFIFDMGNVLMDFSPDYILSQYTQDLDLIATLKTLIFKSTIWKQLDQGLIEFEDAKIKIMDDIPKAYHLIVQDFFDTWYKHKLPREKMTVLIKALKEKGYGIYLCSNAAQLFHSYKDQYPVFEYFDGILISADIKISKPDVRIYEYLLDQYELNASECMFIDDLGENIVAAETLGIHGYHYNGNESMFEMYLKQLNLL